MDKVPVCHNQVMAVISDDKEFKLFKCRLCGKEIEDYKNPEIVESVKLEGKIESS